MTTVGTISISPLGVLQVQLANDGNFHRYCLEPGESLAGQPQEVLDVAALAWNDEVLAAWKALQAAQRPPAPSYADLRRAAYPPIGDQLDALWKGGAAYDAMKQVVQDVKTQYPKP